MFTRIADACVYGYTATRERKSAEYVRCYEGQWLAFLYIDGALVYDASPPGRYYSSDQAKAVCTAFLRAPEARYRVWERGITVGVVA